MDAVSTILIGTIVALGVGLVYTLSKECKRKFVNMHVSSEPLVPNARVLKILRDNPGIVERQRILLNKINKGREVRLRNPPTIRKMLRTMFENPELLKEQMDIIENISKIN